MGLVRGLHGLHGAVRVEVLTDEPARFEPGSVLRREGSDEPLSVVWSQEDPPGVLVRFREIPTRSAAEVLRDAYLEVDAPAGALSEGAYYWHQVEGATVETADGEVLGRVEEVFRVGEAEVFTVRGGSRGEVLVPAVESVVRTFEPRDGRIVVDREALALDDEQPRRPRGRRSSKAARAAAGTECGPPPSPP